jgi:tRNA(fMet)-specific endonuclease VapC
VETARLVVDSDVIVDHLRGRSALIVEALENFRCAFTVVTIYELQAVQNPRHEQILQMRTLMKRVQILSLDSTAAERSADIWRALASQGTTIGLADTLSAGICLAADLPLLTRNVEHFSRVGGLKLITPDGLQAHIEASR